MRFTDQFLDEIRARMPASSVIGQRVKLRKQGREFAGLSPFNAEKTPSFFVNDSKGKWFDFSAGKNGDIFTFLMETEGLSFPEAVERLAAEAGVPMPARDIRAEEREKERASLHEVLEAAARFFEDTLRSTEGAEARAYLDRRGLGPDLQRRFRVGYAPGARSALKSNLAGNDIAQEQMIDAGLLIAGDDIPVSYDRFRHRIMFPITDFRGRIVGFGGRALAQDAKAKYLNSPETELFHKGTLLYNGAEARKAAHDAGSVIVVEGYVDAIQMAAAGFDQTVAPLGTALTERQLQILWRMADEPILCLDGDKAGIRAAGRAAELALPMLQPSKSLSFALLPEGRDPDDLIREAGRPGVEEVLDRAQPLVDVLWAREIEGQSFETPERRAALESRLRGLARTIADESVRRHYEQAFAERLAAFFPPPQRPGRAAQGDRRRRAPRDGRGYPERDGPIPVSDRLKRSAIFSRQGMPALRESVLVLIMINHPDLIARHLDDFASVELDNRDLANLRATLLEIVAEAGDIEGPALREQLVHGPHAALLDRLDAQVANLGLWIAQPDASDVDADQGWLQALTLHRRQRTLHKELKEAEHALAEDASEANLARLIDIRNQLMSAEGTEALIEGFGAASGRGARVF